jgi:hypothetical protein
MERHIAYTMPRTGGRPVSISRTAAAYLAFYRRILDGQSLG